ncbi:sensor histidine kinase [Pseudoflavonifractor phocaeensis]|uniref:sensor histidine kinase n=1 Tax=Pseudoflavonifractor phocaeensis TaxID=1870988 RepID=UPI001958A7C6|nr:GHKL domain-containing protein [Pseudoflavonifractor phocaeensis]MBM6886953.1 GHKL domain-containing protein [Pseudoflavonifractor phocaeensis]
MKLDLYHTLFVGLSQVFLGSYVMLMIDFRRPVDTWRARWIVIVVLVVGANLVGLLFLNFWDTYKRVALFTVTLPYILVTLWCSRHRDFRAVFNMATALFIGCVGTAMATLAELFFVKNEYVSFCVRLISFLLMFFLLRRFSNTYRNMLHQMNHSWGILCMIPITTFLTLLYAINHVRSINPSAALIFICSLLVVCGCAYYLMYLFFDRVQKENSTRYEAQLSILQVSALRSRMEAVRAAEDAIRTERHDLRHQLQAVAELVARGDREAALDFLDAARKRLDERKETSWCRPPVLDAVFASYFDQAQRQGVRVEAKIALPDTLPADEGELAIVLANALENAIHANLELPREQRNIRCKMVGTPSIMLEVSNPCTGAVLFDGEGLPVAQRKGHGLGVQSICAFCRKNGATCQFDLTDGWFRFRLVL